MPEGIDKIPGPSLAVPLPPTRPENTDFTTNFRGLSNSFPHVVSADWFNAQIAEAEQRGFDRAVANLSEAVEQMVAIDESAAREFESEPPTNRTASYCARILRVNIVSTRALVAMVINHD
jgi:hypothetical protein